MKKSILFLVLLAACGKNPEPPPGPVPPPPPDPLTQFDVVGEKITVRGTMKAGSKVSLLEMKAAVAVAVKQLEANY